MAIACNEETHDKVFTFPQNNDLLLQLKSGDEEPYNTDFRANVIPKTDKHHSAGCSLFPVYHMHTAKKTRAHVTS